MTTISSPQPDPFLTKPYSLDNLMGSVVQIFFKENRCGNLYATLLSEDVRGNGKTVYLWIEPISKNSMAPIGVPFPMNQDITTFILPVPTEEVEKLRRKAPAQKVADARKGYDPILTDRRLPDEAHKQLALAENKNWQAEVDRRAQVMSDATDGAVAETFHQLATEALSTAEGTLIVPEPMVHAGSALDNWDDVRPTILKAKDEFVPPEKAIDQPTEAPQKAAKPPKPVKAAKPIRAPRVEVPKAQGGPMIARRPGENAPVRPRTRSTTA